jgi:thiol-disulfide isomerase/thioredoxin
MRKLFLSAAIIAFSFTFSQTRQIIFETGNVASVFEKAKKENKLIFVDAYTSWCGPCKWMAKNVFTNDTVADYFNKTFVNYTLDMEKGEGIEFAKKYEVNCYPNLLFINGEGQVVHRDAGGLSSKQFIESAANSLTSDKTFYANKNKLEKDGLNEQNIFIYVQLLSSACFDPSKTVKDYLKTVKDEDLLKNNNWMLLKDYVQDYEANANKYFISHFSAFQSKYGKPDTDKKMVQLGYSYFTNFYNNKEFDKSAFEKAQQNFKALNWPNSKAILFETELSLIGRSDINKYYALAAKGYMEFHQNDANSLNNMAWTFYENVNNKEQLNAACKMSKRACEIDNSYANLDTYAALLFKCGNKKEAELIATKAIEKAKAENLTADNYKETEDLLNKIKTLK